MFGRLGWAEILVIVVLLFILFGHNKIPGMMKNLANGVNIFKKELKKGADKPENKSGDTQKPVKSVAKKTKKSSSGRVQKNKIKK